MLLPGILAGGVLGGSAAGQDPAIKLLRKGRQGGGVAELGVGVGGTVAEQKQNAFERRLRGTGACADQKNQSGSQHGLDRKVYCTRRQPWQHC